jgi:hypothetical protein
LDNGLIGMNDPSKDQNDRFVKFNEVLHLSSRRFKRSNRSI